MLESSETYPGGTFSTSAIAEICALTLCSTRTRREREVARQQERQIQSSREKKLIRVPIRKTHGRTNMTLRPRYGYDTVLP
ncbi:hypothetical protein J6590_018004 [Homalodisca vitripennis]|nr:hypothetical protein J6590_018004 [Homalodisca vitripennis]